MSIYIAVHFLMDWVYTHPNISAVVSLTSLLLWLSVRRPSNIPPNPWFIFPLVGHRPLLRGDPIETLRRLRKELGEVFSVYIDAQLVIVVSGMAAIREAFLIRGDEFHWRPNTRTCDLFHFGKNLHIEIDKILMIYCIQEFHQFTDWGRKESKKL